MLRKVLCMGIVALFACSAQAGIFGSALQVVTDQRIEVSTDGGATWRTANTNDFSGGVATYATSTFASLTGQTGVEFLGNPTQDAPIAYVSNAGGGIVNNTAFGTGLPAGANPSYSLSDVDGSGVLVDVVSPNPAAPLSAGSVIELVSSTQIDDAGLSSLTNTTSNISANASISNLGINTEGIYRYAADFAVDLTSTIVPPPVGYGISVDTSFIATLTRTRPGGGTAVDEFAPTEVNQSLNTTVTDFYTYSGSLHSTGLEFKKGDTASFVIQNGAQASAAAVPEPMSALIFGAVGLAGLANRRRRRRHA